MMMHTVTATGRVTEHSTNDTNLTLPNIDVRLEKETMNGSIAEDDNQSPTSTSEDLFPLPVVAVVESESEGEGEGEGESESEGEGKGEDKNVEKSLLKENDDYTYGKLVSFK